MGANLRVWQEFLALCTLQKVTKVARLGHGFLGLIDKGRLSSRLCDLATFHDNFLHLNGELVFKVIHSSRRLLCRALAVRDAPTKGQKRSGFAREAQRAPSRVCGAMAHQCNRSRTHTGCAGEVVRAFCVLKRFFLKSGLVWSCAPVTCRCS